MEDMHAKHGPLAFPNGGMSNGHQFSTRILVNHDDDESSVITRPAAQNGHHNGHFTAGDGDLDKFCSRASDLEYVNGDAAKVEDDSFMSIVRTPMIRYDVANLQIRILKFLN